MFLSPELSRQPLDVPHALRLVAHGDVDGALNDRVGLAADRNRMDTLSFEHALHLVDEAARAVRDHAEAVLADRGDPHLAPLLFLHRVPEPVPEPGPTLTPPPMEPPRSGRLPP